MNRTVLPMSAFFTGCQKLHLMPELAWTRVTLGGSSCVQRICRLVTNLISLCVWEIAIIHLDNYQYITSNGNKERWATWCRKRTQKSGCHFPSHFQGLGRRVYVARTLGQEQPSRKQLCQHTFKVLLFKCRSWQCQLRRPGMYSHK